MKDADSTSIRSVSRALSLLSLFSRDRQELTLKDLVEHSGLARTTVLRLLAALQEDGLIWTVDRHTYAVGPGLLRWSGLATIAFRVPQDVREALVGLVASVHETASIYVRDGVRRVCVAYEECDHVLRHVARLGSEGPLWRGASGRVLLRGMEDAHIAEVVNRAPAAAAIQVSTLRAWRSEVGSEEFVITHDEREDGLSVAAVPLVNERSETLASLSIAGPTGRFTPQRSAEFQNALMQAKTTIEASAFLKFRRSSH